MTAYEPNQLSGNTWPDPIALNQSVRTLPRSLSGDTGFADDFLLGQNTPLDLAGDAEVVRSTRNTLWDSLFPGSRPSERDASRFRQIMQDTGPDQQTATVGDRAILARLRLHFVMPIDSSVSSFLDAHRPLYSLLLEATSYLQQCFGADTVFELRAPIDESGSRTLYAVAIWPGLVRDVTAALECFDESWWVANARHASGYLTFTYELV